MRSEAAAHVRQADRTVDVLPLQVYVFRGRTILGKSRVWVETDANKRPTFYTANPVDHTLDSVDKDSRTVALQDFFYEMRWIRERC
jgi:hypothetical protein